jgi:hypothetical protein
MKKVFAALLIAAGGMSFLSPAIDVAHAQSGMLAPGIYTTPEISQRCQSYTRSRLPGSGTLDSERQSVFLACVQKLSRDEQGGGVAPVAAAQPPLISAPVSMPTYEPVYPMMGGPYHSGCVTDEGYGRTGSCDSF